MKKGGKKERVAQIRHLMPLGTWTTRPDGVLCGQAVSYYGSKAQREIEGDTFVVISERMTPDYYIAYCKKIGDHHCERCLEILRAASEGGRR